jgi:hypothetical protein
VPRAYLPTTIIVSPFVNSYFQVRSPSPSSVTMMDLVPVISLISDEFSQRFSNARSSLQYGHLTARLGARW